MVLDRPETTQHNLIILVIQALSGGSSNWVHLKNSKSKLTGNDEFRD